MKDCRWCGEHVREDGIGEFCGENCLLNYADHPSTTIAERSQLLALHDDYMDQLEARGK